MSIETNRESYQEYSCGTAVVHDSGWDGDDKPYYLGEQTGLRRIFTRGFVSFAEARRFAIDHGYRLWSEEFFIWGPLS